MLAVNSSSGSHGRNTQSSDVSCTQAPQTAPLAAMCKTWQQCFPRTHSGGWRPSRAYWAYWAETGGNRGQQQLDAELVNSLRKYLATSRSQGGQTRQQ